MIAHIDADSFFASVLVRKDPRLRGKPVLALGMGGGCVIAATYEAKAKGVKTGMRLGDALKLVPDAIKINSDFRETGLASQQIETILKDTCPIVEQMSIDEWFLDLASLVGGTPQDLDQWTKTIQQRILNETALSVSVGVAPSKLLAKMASEYRKPAGRTIVTGTDAPAGRLYVCMAIETFLRDRPVAAIPGIGPKRQTHAASHAWQTAWDVAVAPSDVVLRLFGRPGQDMQRELLGEVLSPVSSESSHPKSISRCRTFKKTADIDLLWANIVEHLQYTVLKMRRQNLSCGGISVWLRDGDYRHRTNHISLPQPLDTEGMLEPYVSRCFKSLIERGKAYNQAGFGLWKLQERGAAQFSLFTDPEEVTREEKLQASLDAIRERFGRRTIFRGAAMGIERHPKPAFAFPTVE